MLGRVQLHTAQGGEEQEIESMNLILRLNIHNLDF